MKKTVHIVSLGCPKNAVDAEVMAGILTQGGYTVTTRPDRARIILVNTCAFILPAKEESIEEILRLGQWKKAAPGSRRLVVTGCLAQRYAEELSACLPEVDLFLGISEIPAVARHLDALTQEPPGQCRFVAGRPTFLMNAGHPRLRNAEEVSAYLKIADGCSNHCSYCAIPSIRGEARSRKVDDILREAEQLAGQGVKELILTAQDTTAYGLDLKDRPTISLLLKELAGVEGLRWIRLLYAHPARLSDELLKTMAENEKICRYLDMPVQHGDDAILKAMNRRVDGAAIRRIVAKAREVMPDAAIRTSIIVGFPGETKRRFENLLTFIREVRFDHLGVFAYSPEEGTPAAGLSSRVSRHEKERRRRVIMEEQAAISRRINESLVGSIQEVLVEGKGEVEGYPLTGRCRRQAPEIDGVTHLRGRRLRPGVLARCRITAADDYDLYGELL